MEPAPDPGADCRRPASAAGSVTTPWLLILIAWAHLGERLFAPQHRWSVLMSGVGLLSAVLVWQQRGPKFGGRWLLCAWGASEGLQLFVCQGAFVWWPRQGQDGMCAAYTGWPLLWWGLWGLLVVTYWIAMEARDG
jgi:hypothetical protein